MLIIYYKILLVLLQLNINVEFIAYPYSSYPPKMKILFSEIWIPEENWRNPLNFGILKMTYKITLKF